MRPVVAFLVVAVVGSIVTGVAAAQTESRDVVVHVDRCQADLDAATDGIDARTAAGRARAATALVRTAFEALEPAYPVVRGEGGFDDPNAAWLHARALLPDDWNEARVEPAPWRALLARLQRPYGAQPIDAGARDQLSALRHDVEAALANGAAAVRPLALFGAERDEDGTERVAFATVIWNWTPRARLLAFALHGEPIGEDGVAVLLDRVGTCAWTPRGWVWAAADVAREFYLGNVDTRVRILARPIDPIRGEIDVAAGDEEAAFRLEAPALEGQPYAALGFAGPGPSLGTVLRLAFSIRTNVSLFDLSRYLTLP